MTPRTRNAGSRTNRRSDARSPVPTWESGCKRRISGPRRGSPNAGDRGFTLLELVSVLTIVALAAALVAPNMARAFGNAELRMEARTISNLCLEARERAVYRAETWLVIFGPAAGGRRTIYLAGEDGKVADKITLGAGISLRGQAGEGNWSSDPPPLHFFPNGTGEPFRLDLAAGTGSHVQLRLDPLTARLAATELYKEN